MNRLSNRDIRVFVIILISAMLLGVISNAAIERIYKSIYPEKHYEAVTKYSQEYSVPKELIFAVIKVESDFDPNAVSSAGAVGLMQMLPSTYKWLTTLLKEEYSEQDLYNPEISIKYGAYYLRYLYSRFGSWEKAVIAYNWGERNLSEFLEGNEYIEGDYSLIPVGETRHYVKKVIHHWQKYEEIY